MSAFWGSRMSGRPRGTACGWTTIAWALAAEMLLAAAVLAVAIFGLAPVARAGATAKDQGRQVERISIGSHGIVVERGGTRDTLDTSDERERYRYRHRYHHGLIQVDGDGDAVVRVFDDAYVPAGTRVEGDVVAVFGSVEVEGHVTGDVVAVFGSVHLKPGAVVEGDAVSVGGVLEQAEGVIVNGETVSIGFVPVSWGIPALSFTLSAVVAGWLAALFTGWLFAVLFPTRLTRVAAVASRRTAASLLLGMISVPLFVTAVFLLFVTVVGIPLAILLPPAYLLLCFAGQLAATYVLGCKLTGRRLGVGGLMMPMVAGTLLVAVFYAMGALLFVLPGIARPLALFAVLLGCLMVLGLTAIGTGAFLLSKLGAEPREVEWSPGGAPASAPATGLAPPTSATGA